MIQVIRSVLPPVKSRRHAVCALGVELGLQPRPLARRCRKAGPPSRRAGEHQQRGRRREPRAGGKAARRHLPDSRQPDRVGFRRCSRRPTARASRSSRSKQPRPTAVRSSCSARDYHEAGMLSATLAAQSSVATSPASFRSSTLTTNRLIVNPDAARRIGLSRCRQPRRARRSVVGGR